MNRHNIGPGKSNYQVENGQFQIRPLPTGQMASISLRFDEPKVRSVVITCTPDPSFVGSAIAPPDGDLKLAVRWGINNEGGEVRIDAALSTCLVLPCNSVEVIGIYTGSAVPADLNPSYRVEVSSAEGTVRSNKPTLTARTLVPAFGVSPKILVPTFAELLTVSSNPPLNSNIRIDTYNGPQAFATVVRSYVPNGNLPLPTMSGERYVSIVNGNGADYTVTTQWLIGL